MYAIRVKFQPATDYRGAKLVATTADRKRVAIGYPHHLPESEKYPAAARALCEKWGWTGRLVGANLSDGEMVFVFDPAARGALKLTFATWDDQSNPWAFLDRVGTYHAPSHAHPGTCRGCTADSSKHGQPIVIDEPKGVKIPTKPIKRKGNRR